MVDYVMLLDENLKLKLEENHPWTGSYRLCCLSDDNKTFVPVERILKTDTAGVLYIGASDYIPNRIQSLKVSILKTIAREPVHSDLYPHNCGKKYLNKEIQKKFPVEKLCVQILPSNKAENINSHYILENEGLKNYERDFGEPPPLNEGRRY